MTGLGIRSHAPKGPRAVASLGVHELSDGVCERARELGFARMGIASPEPLERGEAAWKAFLARGQHGSMGYLTEGQGPNRARPADLLPGVRSVVVVALPYGAPTTVPLRTSAVGSVASYAQGQDYHRVLKGKLNTLADAVAELSGRTVSARACVDTAPLLERELAVRAGVGFFGKNTMLIVPGLGSYVVLGELLLDVELTPTLPHPQSSTCGSCTACLDACPTHAFAKEYVLDAQRCISYLTIEHTGDIPAELRARMGNHVFGCDICQQVCPFNQTPRAQTSAPELAATQETPELGQLLFLRSGDYRRWVKGRALRRASREQLARNAAIALGNSSDPEAAKHLLRALNEHRYPQVRALAALSLGKLLETDAGLDSNGVFSALEYSAQRDPSSEVRAAAAEVIAAIAPSPAVR